MFNTINPFPVPVVRQPTNIIRCSSSDKVVKTKNGKRTDIDFIITKLESIKYFPLNTGDKQK